jgi:hypothetical protein
MGEMTCAVFGLDDKSPATTRPISCKDEDMSKPARSIHRRLQRAVAYARGEAKEALTGSMSRP